MGSPNFGPALERARSFPLKFEVQKCNTSRVQLTHFQCVLHFKKTIFEDLGRTKKLFKRGMFLIVDYTHSAIFINFRFP